jgi:DNA-directed RNA polymerase subunit RPC12/RpoP
MAIEFKCPHCEKPLQADDQMAGQKAKCPGCGKELEVPQKQT